MFPPPETLKAHPDYERVVSHLKAIPMRDDGPTRLVASAYVAAQLYYLTGSEVPGSRTILRAIRNGWPLPFENFDHSVTLDWGPMMAKAAWMWPLAKEELDSPLRWLRWRMSEPKLVSQTRSGAMLATNLFVTLRLACMIDWVLGDKAHAAKTACYGIGTNAHQRELPWLSVSAFDKQGFPRFDCGRIGHWANTSRPAAAWLYRWFVGVIPPAFYEAPMRLLCVGNRTPVCPALTDHYPDEDHPLLGGDISAWYKGTVIDTHARRHLRRQTKPSIDWLMVPDDSSLPDSYFAERPPNCRGDRIFGGWKITETATKSVVTFTCPSGNEVAGKTQRLLEPVTWEIGV